MNPLKYQPTKLNEAQRLLMSLGVDDLLLVGHHGGKRETFTKKGPGRKPGKPKDRSVDTKPLTARDVAAPGLFLGQHTNKAKNERRALIGRIGGIRQFKRWTQRNRPECATRILL